MSEEIRKTMSGKYVVWFSGITTREYSILMKYLPSNLFEIHDDISYDDINNIGKLHILETPDIFIYGEDNRIKENVIYDLKSNLCSVCSVTLDKKNELDDSLELNEEEIEYECLEKGCQKKKLMTNLQYAIEKICDMCQISEFSKLQKFAKKESKKVLFEDQENLKINQDSITFTMSKDLMLKTAKKLNSFISIKDNYTAAHCDRVATYALALGKQIGLNKDEMFDLKLAAYLHDIGKIALPDAIISKNSKLTEQEFNLMKKHVELGSTVLPTTQLGYLNKVVRGHHEKFDGTGYPDRLKGNEIPMYAQILAIADSFDAMTSQRTYNHVKSADEAFDDLRKHTLPVGVSDGMGMSYNPELVDQFIYALSNDKTIMNNLAESKKQADRLEMIAKQNDIDKLKLDENFKQLVLNKEDDYE